jgi:pSer/pThr/pTyr-binding forkhead associated (FHA) protein
LTKDSTVIGSDPHKASLVLTGESVSEVHAVLTRLETGEYALQDAGSISGTWVNYAPVPISTISNTNGAAASGVLLAHGDLIHIGRVPLVFELYKPVPVQFHIETLGNLE